jgi:glutathione S-transferase
MSSNKKQRTHPQYELLYWPGIPGRGEYVRLAFEASGVPYTDVGNESTDGGKAVVSACCSKDSTGDDDGNPPSFAPPGLRVAGEGKGGKMLFISQTPNILLYLGPKLGLAGEDEQDALYVNELTLTALDMCNEAHDTHHPIAVMDYYEGMFQRVSTRTFPDAKAIR